jgi:hypothetical protein
MFEQCLNEAERILAMDKDVIVPVKKVWQEVAKQGKGQGFEVPSLADFEVMLEADSRFEFMPSQRELLGEDGDLTVEERADEEAEMERLGFYSGDRVKLKRVELTPELLGGIIRRKVDRTMEALTKAWEMRPNDDQDAEDQLLDILARTQKLQREVKEAFSEERMAAVAKSFKKKNSPKRAVLKRNRKSAVRKADGRKHPAKTKSVKKRKRGSTR